MNIFDIIIGIILLWALYKGYNEGVVVQLGGIVGVLIGAFFAFKYGSKVGHWFGLEQTTASVVGFIAVLLLVVIAIAIVGRLLKGLFKVAGLGVFDQIGGALLSMLKVGLIISVILCALEAVNDKTRFINQKTIDKSALYKPVRMIATYAFPYVDFIKKTINDQSK